MNSTGFRWDSLSFTFEIYHTCSLWNKYFKCLLCLCYLKLIHQSTMPRNREAHIKKFELLIIFSMKVFQLFMVVCKRFKIIIYVNQHFQRRHLKWPWKVKNVERLGSIEPERSNALEWIVDNIHGPLLREALYNIRTFFKVTNIKHVNR